MFDLWNTAEADFLLWIQETLRNPICNVFMNLITLLGENGLFYIALSVLLLFFRRTRKAGALFCVAVACDGMIVNLILKNLFARVRPFLLTEFAGRLVPIAWHIPGSYSFPSGHTAIAFCIATASFFVCRKREKILLTTLAVLVGLSRLYLGVHYPTDVLFGAGFGIIAALTAALILHFLPASLKRKANKILPDLFPDAQ